MKQRFRIGHIHTMYGFCFEWQALNESAKQELWRYHPELKQHTGSNYISDSHIVINVKHTRRYLPPLMRL